MARKAPVRTECTDRIDRLHLFGYIVYRCTTLLVGVVKVSRVLVFDRCGQLETTAQFKTQAGINGRLPPLAALGGSPPTSEVVRQVVEREELRFSRA
jgi:hypothetical protein